MIVALLAARMIVIALRWPPAPGRKLSGSGLVSAQHWLNPAGPNRFHHTKEELMSIRSAPNSRQPVRVMIVDDSALMRKLLGEMLSRSAELEVIDTAMDGQFALDHLRRVRPDVILMDIDMPRLDGLSALDRIVAEYALPVVMCSSRTTDGSRATLDALARGAVDFIEKPTLAALTSGEGSLEIITKVRDAFGARVNAPPRRALSKASAHTATVATLAAPVPSGDALTTLKQLQQLVHASAPELIAIGTSTGGPPALEQVLVPLPANFPLGIVIVQHMPAGFTALLANHLNRVAQIRVREAVHGDLLEPGLALIAPGGAHLRVVRGNGQYQIVVDRTSALVSGHRPSVDVLFESAAQASQGRAAALLMTGMGSDGAAGMGRLVEAGALTIAQSPDTCVISGMPKSAIERGFVRAILPLEELAGAITVCGAAWLTAHGKQETALPHHH
jgi:two-component system chemotaxis response regulator CheB